MLTKRRKAALTSIVAAFIAAFFAVNAAMTMTISFIDGFLDFGSSVDLSGEASQLANDLEQACNGNSQNGEVNLVSDRGGINAYVEICSDSDTTLCYPSQERTGEQNRFELEGCDSISFNCQTDRLTGDVFYRTTGGNGEAQLNCIENVAPGG